MVSDSLETFSGSQLLKAEPDASKFPTEVPANFEARGYTVWDTSVNVLARDGPPMATKSLYSLRFIFIQWWSFGWKDDPFA